MSDEKTAVERGAEIRSLREAVKLSQGQLAELVGTNQQTVQRIESGTTGYSRATPKIMQALRHLQLKTESPDDPLTQLYLASLDRIQKKKPRSTKARDKNQFDKTYKHVDISFSREESDGILTVDNRTKFYLPRRFLLDASEETYAFYNTSSDMMPEFDPGDTLIVDPKAPPIAGVACLFMNKSDVDGRATIKRLVSSSDENWLVKRWSPLGELELPKAVWPICHRVIGKASRP